MEIVRNQMNKDKIPIKRTIKIDIAGFKYNFPRDKRCISVFRS